MSKNVRFVFILAYFIAAPRISNAQGEPASFTRYVDPFIGTGFHGHVFLGANTPFGAVQLGPVNLSEGWDWCSGYHYSDSTIIGFAHTHLSGTGIGDLGDVLLMPATGPLLLNKGKAGDWQHGNTSLFSHADEVAVPGYYSVLLKRYGIRAELTATTRTGFHRYTFPADSSSHIIIDLVQGIGWDRPTDTYIRKINDSTIAGYRFSKGWAADQRIYFTAVFSRPFRDFGLYNHGQEEAGTTVAGDSLKAVVWFDTRNDRSISVKVGISPVSMDNAWSNIDFESPDWNFEAVRAAANAAWNSELGKLRVQMPDQGKMKVFYTAMYHTMIAPSVFNDYNGDYYGTDKQVHRKAGFTNLTTMSLWDVYRAAAPLFTIIHPEKVSDLINSLLAIYKEQGRLPVWHLMGNETNTMPGNSAIQLVADAYLKGFRGFDTSLAWEAVKTTATLDLRGLKYVKKLGYIPADSMTESVAMGLEYAISDGCIALMAKRMGKTADYHVFAKRAAFYKNYFDASTRFVRGRLSEKSWREPFSPFESRHMKDDFSEGNAWQYTWLVPQDVRGLIAELGGDKPFVAKLDSLFRLQHHMGKEASADITGLIGQYAHGNEPGHHIPYLYMYAGQPWKSAQKIRYILDSLYAPSPAGICGNEDVGQMSAWYIWSTLGFYPVHPANGVYVFGSPLVKEATLDLPGGKSFHLKVYGNSPANIYIQKVKFNGHDHPNTWIRHETLTKGGELEIWMGPKPSDWGKAARNRPQAAD